jgi:hypothetical protein
MNNLRLLADFFHALRARKKLTPDFENFSVLFFLRKDSEIVTVLELFSVWGPPQYIIPNLNKNPDWQAFWGRLFNCRFNII